jgi:hypothetical protein
LESNNNPVIKVICCDSGCRLVSRVWPRDLEGAIRQLAPDPPAPAGGPNNLSPQSI